VSARSVVHFAIPLGFMAVMVWWRKFGPGFMLAHAVRDLADAVDVATSAHRRMVVHPRPGRSHKPKRRCKRVRRWHPTSSSRIPLAKARPWLAFHNEPAARSAPSHRWGG